MRYSEYGTPEQEQRRYFQAAAESHVPGGVGIEDCTSLAIARIVANPLQFGGDAGIDGVTPADFEVYVGDVYREFGGVIPRGDRVFTRQQMVEA